VTVTPNPGTAGQTITATVTVTVTNTSGTAKPTGTVELRNGTTVLGSGTLDSNGQATIKITQPAGSYSLTAVYLGNSSFKGSSSATSALTVNRATPPVFTGVTSIATGKGRKRRVTGAQLSFNAALTTGSAQNPGNYRVTQIITKKKTLTVTVVSATFSNNSVTLTLSGVKPKKPLQLVATGLIGANNAAVATITTGFQ
jgi:hypothetical protein